MNFKPYPRYKSSGISWLSQVPEGWNISPLKWLVSQSTDKPQDGVTSGEYIGMENIESFSATWIPSSNNDSSSGLGNLFEPGDVLFGKLRPYLAKAWHADRSGVCSSEFLVLRPEKIDGRFLLLQMLNQEFVTLVDSSTYGSKMPRASWDFIGSIRLPVPSPAEQQAIVAFLHRETAKIDTLIAKQEKLIELLKEKRQAVISHAVTKGLDPTVPMKPSGVEWLGNVPSHWSVVKSRRYFSQRKDRALEGDRQLTASQKYGVIYQEDYMALENSRVMQVITGSEILKHIEPNDFVISMRSFQGGLEWSSLSGSVSSAYVALIPSNEVHGTFFSFLFKSQPYIQALQSTSNLVRDGQALRYDNFVQVDLPLPPIDEQAAIAKFIKTEVEKIDRLALKAKQAIALQKEHRVALISAVVTGKLDIRDAAVDLQEAA